MSIARLMQMGAAGNILEGWDLANAALNGGAFGQFYVGSQDTGPNAVFFKPDGTKMYVLGNTTDIVIEYDLSTAWNISTASYLQSFSVTTQEIFAGGLFFKPDGTKMYITGTNGDDVNEYSLSSAWDVSTASYVQNFSVAAQETTPSGVFFKSDGAKMYIIGSSSDTVSEYNLSTAWNISTASYSQNFSIAAQEASPTGVFFKSDGTKMYVTGSSGDDVNEYTLSSAWDISTASYAQNFSVAAQNNQPQGVFFRGDGLKMYIAGTSRDSIYSYTLSSAWDISTASWDAPAEDYYSADFAFSGLFFKPDGAKMYVIDATADAVNEYSLSPSWEISTASYVQTFSISAQEIFPQGLFFKPDGTKMYVIGTDGDDVNEYTLSTAWDISSATYTQNFSVSAQASAPNAVFFRDDGIKMYVVDSTGDDVNEYDLSSAWDVSTASYVQNFSVSAQATFPTGLFFKPDGAKMFVDGLSSDSTHEYDLSTAWDISTATYVQSFSLLPQQSSPRGLFFRPNGLKMYVADSSTRSVWAYDL